MKALPYCFNTTALRKFVTASITVSTAVLFSTQAISETAQQTYDKYCASCHGKQLTGGMGPSLVDTVWKHGSDDTSIANAIKNGAPRAGMPAWKAMFDEQTIRSLVILIREQGKRHSENTNAKTHTQPNGTYTTKDHAFNITKTAELPGTIWAVSALDQNTLIATLKDGRLFTITAGSPKEITGIPTVWSDNQAGLLDVIAHPNYSENGWIYLSYVDKKTSITGTRGMTAVVRGKISNGKWVQQEQIFKAEDEFYTGTGYHFGSRFAFVDDYLFFSIGDRANKDQAQDLSQPNGKIHRLHLDGRTPKDNPFINDKNAYPTVWSYGHRNPQGLDTHPVTNQLWETEHGPRGGDEVNLIEPKLNYGWPKITYGMNYNGTPMDAGTHKAGMEQPLHYWVPSIATGGIDFYDGDKFPRWKNHILTSGMAAQALHLVTLDKSHSKVVSDEVLFNGLGRVRDVLSGPDGLIYVAINPNGGASGIIYAMQPATP